MANDARVCGMCFRDLEGMQHACGGCRRTFCTRPACEKRHAAECAVPMTPAKRVTSGFDVNGFDVELYQDWRRTQA
jgi:hypothetical protein